MKITGEAQLKTSIFSEHVLLSIDPINDLFQAKIAKDRVKSMCDALNSGYDRSWMTSGVELKDVRLLTTRGYLTAESISDIFISRISPGSWAVYDSYIARALDLYEMSVGVISVDFSLRNGFMRLTAESERQNTNEALFTGNRAKIHPFNINVLSQDCSIAEHDDILTVRSTGSLSSIVAPFQLAWSYVQGFLLRRLAVSEGRHLEVYFARSETRRSFLKLYLSHDQIPHQIGALLRYLLSVNPNEYRKLETVLTFIINAAFGSVDINSNVVNLFVVVEMLDGSKTMSDQTLASTFGLNNADAGLLRRVRNRVIHQGADLADAVSEANLEVASQKNSGSFSCFRILSDTKAQATSFYFRLYRLICSHIFQLVGYTDRCNDFSELLADVET